MWQLYPIWGLDVVARFEGGITPRASNAINQIDSSGDGFSFDGTHIRKLELIFNDKRLGTLSLGQGSMAADGISEIDLSGTKVTAYSSVSQSAGGQFLRLTNGALSPLIIGDVFNNFDGSNVTGYNSDGSRALRARYDTPKYRGMTLSFAVGNEYLDTTGETYADVALRYDGPFQSFRVSGGLGFSLEGNEETTSGSLSAVHHQTGANFTVAMGHGSQSGSYTYFKIGMLRSVFPIGKTAVSLDIYNGSDLASLGSTSHSYSLAVSQQISSQNIEIFGLLRRYDFDDLNNDYYASTAFFTGLRWKF